MQIQEMEMRNLLNETHTKSHPAGMYCCQSISHTQQEESTAIVHAFLDYFLCV